jgi:putative flippase GtrA
MMSLQSSSELRRMLVYIAVGSLNTAVCYALFAALIGFCRWHYELALAADYAFGLVLGYGLHRLTTFGDRQHLRRAFGKYTITLLATFVANFALLAAIVGAGWLAPLMAQAVAMAVVTLGSYLVQKNWVFRSHHAHEKSAEGDESSTPSALTMRRAA